MQVGEAYLEGVPRPNPSQLVGPIASHNFWDFPTYAQMVWPTAT